MQLRAFLVSGVLAMGAIGGACTTSNKATAPGLDQLSPSNALPASETCFATEARWAIGQQRSDDVLERARVAAKASVARFLLPNQPITMEYLGSRLNLDLDERNLVRDVRCG